MSDHHILTFRQPLGAKGQLRLKTSHILPALLVWKSSTNCSWWRTGVNLHCRVTLLTPRPHHPRPSYVTPSRLGFSLKFFKFCETSPVCCHCKCQVTVAFSPLCKVFFFSFQECEFGTETLTSNCVCSDFFFFLSFTKQQKRYKTTEVQQKKKILYEMLERRPLTDSQLHCLYSHQIVRLDLFLSKKEDK